MHTLLKRIFKRCAPARPKPKTLSAATQRKLMRVHLTNTQAQR